MLLTIAFTALLSMAQAAVGPPPPPPPRHLYLSLTP